MPHTSSPFTEFHFNSALLVLTHIAVSHVSSPPAPSPQYFCRAQSLASKAPCPAVLSGSCALRGQPALTPPAMPVLQERLATTWTSLTSPSASPALQDLSVPEVHGSSRKLSWFFLVATITEPTRSGSVRDHSGRKWENSFPLVPSVPAGRGNFALKFSLCAIPRCCFNSLTSRQPVFTAFQVFSLFSGLFTFISTAALGRGTTQDAGAGE